MFNRKYVTGLSVLALSTAIAGIAPAAAQVDELVVTAQKREQSLQEVPISLSAVSGDKLQQLAIDDIQEVTLRTPGVTYSRAGAEAQVFVRGVGTDAFGVTVDPSVAIHLDGVYQARPQMGLQQFLDVERVEILRGPQGTLYGRNATAGVINIVSRQPTDEFEGYVSAAYGSFDRFDTQGAVSGPITDALSARVAVRYLNDDGFTDDLDPAGGDEIDDNDMIATRGILAFEPNDRVRAALTIDFTDFESGNRTIRPLDDLGIADALGAMPLPSFDETRNPEPTFLDWETWGATLDISWDLNDYVSLTSISGYRRFDMDFLFNTDGTEIPVTRTNFAWTTEQFSQELRLQSENLDRWRWLLGGYFLTEDKVGTLALQRFTNNVMAVSPFTIFLPNDDEGRAWAVFGELGFDVTEWFSVTVGARYSKERKEDVTSFANLPGVVTITSPLAPPLFVLRDDEETWDSVDPRVVLEFKPQDNVLLYASVSKGFKSGGWNAFAPGEAFDPEEIWAYEGGIKSDWYDDRLRLNLAGFYYDYSDLQVNTFINSVAVTTNAAEATVWGIEFEAVAAPIENLELAVNYAYLDAEYDSFISPFGGLGPQDLEGNRLRNAPKHKVNASAEYAVPVSNYGELVAFTQVTYQSDVFFSQFNEDVIGQDGYALLDARLAFRSSDGRWEVAIFGKNLTDKEYLQNAVRFTSTSNQTMGFDEDAIGNALGYPAPGREIGGQIRFNF